MHRDGRARARSRPRRGTAPPTRCRPGRPDPGAGASDARSTVTLVGRRVTSRAGALEQALGVVARRDRLDDRRRALRPGARRGERPTSPARTRPGARSRSREAARPRRRAARGRRVVSTSPPIRRSGSATRSIGRAESDASPTSSNRPSWPARTPASRRMSVPAFPQSIGAAGGRSPRGPTPQRRSVSTSSSTTSTPSARTAAIVASVSAERPNPEMRSLALAQGGDQDGPVRDRLVPRHGNVSDEGGTGLDAHLGLGGLTRRSCP